MSDKTLKDILKRLDSLEKKVDSLVETDPEAKEHLTGVSEEISDDLYEEVVMVIYKAEKASASYIQRCFGISFHLASKIIENLEKDKVIGPPIGSRPREVLIKDPIKFLLKRKSN